MNNLAYELAMIYAKTKFAEHCKRMKDEDFCDKNSFTHLETLDDYFEESYNHYKTNESLNKMLTD